MIFSEDDRERIRAEEILRLEIRESLRRPKSPIGQVWAFLNSSFGIWLLSSVVLASIVSLYSSFRSSEAAEAAKLEATTKADMEISLRLRDLARELERVGAKGFSEDRYSKAMRVLNKPRHLVFKRFDDRPLSSVLWQLRASVEESEVASVEDAMDGALKLEEMSRVSPSILDPTRVEVSVEEMKALLCSSFAKERWTRGRPYLECNR